MRAFLALCLVALAVADPLPYDPEGLALLTPMAAVNSSDYVYFHINLKQKNLDKLEELHDQISDPTSPMFRQYMTRAEIVALTAPSVKDVIRVQNYLARAGMATQNKDDFLIVNCTASTFKKVFDADLSYVKQPSGTIQQKALSGYTIPSAISDVVVNLGSIGWATRLVRSGIVRGSNPELSFDAVVPLTMQNLYNYVGLTITNNISVGCGELSDDNAYGPKDLQSFATGNNIASYQTPTNYGPFNDFPPDDESTLDIQLQVGCAPQATHHFYVVEQGFLEMAQTLEAQNDPPYTFSISWGQDEETTTSTQISQTDAEFMKLNARGRTMIISSGDAGSCNGYDFLNVNWPASSAYVLGASATELNTVNTNFAGTKPEVCTSTYTCGLNGTEILSGAQGFNFAPGGGFSAKIKQPHWQAAVVAAYFADSSIPKPPSGFNKANRAVPDVSANGDSDAIFLEGEWAQVGGTSASAPQWAAMLAHANNYLASNGQATLGFVNPQLYSIAAAHPDVFHSNLGTTSESNAGSCSQGWHVNPNGWDPATGLGTVDLKKLMPYLMPNTGNGAPSSL